MQLLSRSTLWSGKFAAAVVSLLATYSERPEQEVQSGNCVYHAEPPGVDYSDNDTVFGRILAGQMPARVLAESETLLTFADAYPRARFHALVIPKRQIGSVLDLPTTNDDLQLLRDMHSMAAQVLLEHESGAYQMGDYRLCFHVPPFNSVQHLHLHVLAPVSEMSWFFKSVKYNTRTRWATSFDVVMERLQTGKKAVPYMRPSSLKNTGRVANGLYR